jgi:Bacteriophage holin of superfamily 6 (Holin_LLH)
VSIPTVPTPPAPSAVTALFDNLIQAAGAILATALVVLVHKAIKYMTAKTAVEVPAKLEETIDEWARRAINYAEEKAHQANQAKADKMKGPEKLEAAVTFAMDLAQQHGLANIAKEKLVRAIESRLGEDR